MSNLLCLSGRTASIASPGRDTPARHQRAPSPRYGAVTRALRWIERQRRRRLAVRQLERLDTRLLRDIGIERDDIAGYVDDMMSMRRGAAVTGQGTALWASENRPEAWPCGLRDVDTGSPG